MPQPTPNQVHVDAPLTSISVAFMQSASAYIADKVFPVVPVEHKSDLYYKFTANDWFRDQMQKRAPASESAGGGFNITTDNYNCDVWAFHKDVDNQTRANSDPQIDPDITATRFVTQIGLIRRERQWVTDYFTPGVWGTNLVGTTDFVKWDNFGASDPIADISTARRTILTKTGQRANTVVVGYDVHEALKRHPLLIERVKYTSSESVTRAMIARFFEVDNYFVAEAIYATNQEGQAEAYDFTHGKSVLVAHVASSPGLMVPSAGYTFTWRGLTGLNSLGTSISSFYLPAIKSDRIEIEMAFDCKVVSTALGYFMSSVVD